MSAPVKGTSARTSGTGLPLRGGGIFATTDGGETWAPLPATRGADFHFVNDLQISARDDRVLYAATRTGVWRSRDRGAVWERILVSTVRGGCLDLALRTDHPEDVLFAACGTFEQATVYRSPDARGPAVFTPVLSDPGMGRTTLAIAPSDQTAVYALAASNVAGPNGLFEQGLHALFRSSDGGAAGTWAAQVRNTDSVKLARLILTNPIAASGLDCGTARVNAYIPMGWYVASLAVDPADADTVWAAGVDWFRSRDGGRTWGMASEWWRRGVPGFVHADQHELVFHPGYNGTTNQQAFALTDGGIYRTDNARASDSRNVCDAASIQVGWRSLNHNLGVTPLYHGLPFPDGTAYLGGAQDNGTLFGSASDGIDGWADIVGGDGGYVAIDPSNPRIIYAESQWANILRSTDGGRTFASITGGLDPPASNNLRGERANFLFITPFVADPGQRGTLWTGGRYIYRRAGGSDDEGRDVVVGDAADRNKDRRRETPDGERGTWRRASERLLGDGLVSAITVAAGDSNRVAAGATDGRLYVTDAGASGAGARWDITRPRDGWVTSVTHDPSNPEVMYATYGGFGGAHVFKSVDGGRTWRSIDGFAESGIPDVPVHSIAVDPVRPDRLYLGTARAEREVDVRDRARVGQTVAQAWHHPHDLDRRGERDGYAGRELNELPERIFAGKERGGQGLVDNDHTRRRRIQFLG